MVDKNNRLKALGTRPWARTGFDIEGIVGALAAWLGGLLLGAIWSPLFWLGALAAILVLLATRKQERISPDATNLVLAPCDGVVHSITRAVPPSELRLEQTEHLRLRVASSPASPNTLHAPITGEIMSVIQEEPNPSIIFATEPDIPGLAVAHIGFSSRGDMVGFSVMAGGFGPRLEMLGQSRDAVLAGRVVGKRRLGGWCDIYLKPDARLLVREGQTLIGAETVLCRLAVEPADIIEEQATDEADSDIELPPAEVVSEEVTGEEPPKKPAPDDDDLSEAEISELFEKLKQKADEASEP